MDSVWLEDVKMFLFMKGVMAATFFQVPEKSNKQPHLGKLLCNAET